MNIIYNVNTILKPYLPNSCGKIDEYLNVSNKDWDYKKVEKVEIISDIKPLYERYDKKVIEEEIKQLDNK